MNFGIRQIRVCARIWLMDNMPLIRTHRLTLRQLQPGDAGPVFAYRSLPQVKRYQLWDPASEAEVGLFIERLLAVPFRAEDSWFQFAILLSSSDMLIGDCGIHFVAGRTGVVEIGITLAPDYQGQGYASETLQGLFQYLFDGLGIERVEGVADSQNTRSIRLMERVGMWEDASRRQQVFVKGEWVHEVTHWTDSHTRAGRPVQ